MMKMRAVVHDEDNDDTAVVDGTSVLSRLLGFGEGGMQGGEGEVQTERSDLFWLAYRNYWGLNSDVLEGKSSLP
jgi:hypothetical protein